MPPYNYAKGRQAEERRQEQRHLEEHAHLMRTAKPARFSLLDKLMAWTGDLLIAAGRELHEQCGMVQALLDNPALHSKRG
jgi:hypothetical protein